MKLRNDGRGSAGSGFNYLIALFGAGLMALVLRLMVIPITDMARADTNSDVALTGVGYTETVVTYFAFAMLVTATFYLLAAAIADRRFDV